MNLFDPRNPGALRLHRDCLPHITPQTITQVPFSFAPLRSESVVLLVQSETGQWSRILRTRIWGQVNTWYLLNPAMGQAAYL